MHVVRKWMNTRKTMIHYGIAGCSIEVEGILTFASGDFCVPKNFIKLRGSGSI